MGVGGSTLLLQVGEAWAPVATPGMRPPTSVPPPGHLRISHGLLQGVAARLEGIFQNQSWLSQFLAFYLQDP